MNIQNLALFATLMMIGIALAGAIPTYVLYQYGLITMEIQIVLAFVISLAIFGVLKLWSDRQFKKEQERICKEYKEGKYRNR